MKISNWLFRWWYVKKLRAQQNSPFKMKNETDALKSNCIAEIQHATQPRWLSIKRLLYKLGVKSVQQNRSRIYRDRFGKQSLLPNPVFSQNQIAEFNTKYRVFLAVLIGFTVAESFLYFLTASLFVPGGSLVMKISVAVFLALLIMFALNYAIEKHFLYREAVERHGKKELDEQQLVRYRDLRNIGYLLIVLSFAAIVFAGLSRIFFLENIPTGGLDAAKAHSIQQASQMASIFTMLITIIAAVFMGIAKQELNKYGNQFKVCRYWQRALVKRNDYTQQLIREANAVLLLVEEKTEKYWQLVIDLKRVYQMETEYDSKYEDLHAEYMELKAKEGFSINEHMYRKFAPIQCTDEMLFKYGIANDREMKAKIAFALEILRQPEEHICEQLQPLPVDADSKLLLTEVNGYHRHNGHDIPLTDQTK